MVLNINFKMIILRQNNYAESKHGVFNYYIEHESDLDDVEKRKFEALKKKYPDVWEEVKSGRNTGSNTKYNYGGEYNYNYNWEDFKKDYKDHLKEYKKEAKKAAGLMGGLYAGNIAARVGDKLIKEKRRSKINEKVGKREKLKLSERQRLEQYKEMTEKQKSNLLHGSKKYVIGRTAREAFRSGLSGAANGSIIGTVFNLRHPYKGARNSAVVCGSVGLGIGALKGYEKGKKELSRVSKSDKEKDLVKVSQGKMTETEYKKKYNL